MNLITSQPWLADTSVLDNVWLAAPDAQIEQVVEACSSVGLDIVTRNWGSGLGGGVGPGGGLLSSGERQRVAIARAMLKRPRLLILDEGTSALDVASEREIWATLRAALPETAILVISHRLATAQLAPTIFVLDAGRIITTDKGEIVSQTTPFRNLFGVV